MNKHQCITLYFLLLISYKLSAQDCPTLNCFSANTSLFNSCEEFKTYARITNSTSISYAIAATWDFGDGSTPVTTNYPSFGGPITVYPETTHSYATPGTYVATLTVTGGNNTSCLSKATVEVDVTGGCETCVTYSNLSTGYDPSTNLPIPTLTSTNPAGPDPNWIVVRRFDLSAPTYTPIPSTIYNYSSNQTNVIYPKNGFCPDAPLGRSRFISVNTTHNSTYGTPNIHTYRRHFNLPSSLPLSNMYTLMMSIKAEDYIFDLQLNGASILSNPTVGGAFQISINSCSGLFKADSNFIDITVADINGGSTQLDAEVLLYDCPLIVPCTGNGGWTYTWTWNTNWGYGWFYYWSAWYCVNFGGGSCPPNSPPTDPNCPACQPCCWGNPIFGTSTSMGWGWVFVSGWGWMWLQGGSSGSGSLSCSNCITSFSPIPGKKYLVSAWVKEKNAPQSKTTYTYPGITILFPSISGSTGTFLPSGNIIDGWQRIEGEFTIPAGASDISLKLDCTTSDCYYDDIRILPFEGSMKSYVYDPVNMRLVAELDERNFATLYEYDEEGKLVRVKKETEKGKMTIKENRDNIQK